MEPRPTVSSLASVHQDILRAIIQLISAKDVGRLCLTGNRHLRQALSSCPALDIVFNPKELLPTLCYWPSLLSSLHVTHLDLNLPTSCEMDIQLDQVPQSLRSLHFPKHGENLPYPYFSKSSKKTLKKIFPELQRLVFGHQTIQAMANWTTIFPATLTHLEMPDSNKTISSHLLDALPGLTHLSGRCLDTFLKEDISLPPGLVTLHLTKCSSISIFEAISSLQHLTSLEVSTVFINKDFSPEKRAAMLRIPKTVTKLNVGLNGDPEARFFDCLPPNLRHFTFGLNLRADATLKALIASKLPVSIETFRLRIALPTAVSREQIVRVLPPKVKTVCLALQDMRYVTQEELVLFPKSVTLVEAPPLPSCGDFRGALPHLKAIESFHSSSVVDDDSFLTYPTSLESITIRAELTFKALPHLLAMDRLAILGQVSTILFELDSLPPTPNTTATATATGGASAEASLSSTSSTTPIAPKATLVRLKQSSAYVYGSEPMIIRVPQRYPVLFLTHNYNRPLELDFAQPLSNNDNDKANLSRTTSSQPQLDPRREEDWITLLDSSPAVRSSPSCRVVNPYHLDQKEVRLGDGLTWLRIKDTGNRTGLLCRNPFPRTLVSLSLTGFQIAPSILNLLHDCLNLEMVLIDVLCEPLKNEHLESLLRAKNLVRLSLPGVACHVTLKTAVALPTRLELFDLPPCPDMDAEIQALSDQEKIDMWASHGVLPSFRASPLTMPLKVEWRDWLGRHRLAESTTQF